MRLDKLTPKERELLHRAVNLILTGEWPWEYHDARTQTRERTILSNASQKLAYKVPSRVDRTVKP